jgi:dihydrofolate reductase
MGRLIVVSFTTLDGVVQDPDGSDGTPFGGWAMRHGPQAIGGDKFHLGPILEHGTLLFGRRTWEHFATLWPQRDTDFARAMNTADKAVLTSGGVDGRWSNSRRVDAPVLDWLPRQTRDVVVIGSLSVVDLLVGRGLVDEYRLLIFPTVLGAGRALFRTPQALTTVSVAPSGPGALTVLTP